MAGSLDLSALVNWLSGQCFRAEELVELCAERRRGRHAVVAAETQAARSLARAHLELDLALAWKRQEEVLQVLEELGAELRRIDPQHDPLGVAGPGLRPRRRQLVLAGLERLGLGDDDAHVAAPLVVHAAADEDHAVELDMPGHL